MNTIDLRKFVDINIQANDVSSAATTRETVALLTDAVVAEQTFSNLEDAKVLEDTCPNCYKAIKTFFDCGGKKVHLVPNVTYSDTNIISAVQSLPDEEIVVTYALEGESLIPLYTTLAKVAKDYAVDNYGIKTKVFIAPINVFTASATYNSAQLELDKISGLCLKFDVSENYANRADMSIAAYLSKIDILVADSIVDYCYTVEPDELAYSEANNTTIDNSRSNNINVDIFLAAATRNIGGNCTNGEDIVNFFVRIILQQTVTDSLIQLLSTHLKGATGLTKIYGSIVRDLEKYLTSGYLVTDKVWTKPDVQISYNNQNYMIIKKGTPLSNGYILTILPYTSLSETDRAAHKTPPIYLILAEQYGIRMITINGEVI